MICKIRTVLFICVLLMIALAVAQTQELPKGASTTDLGGGVSLELELIKPGTFTMGIVSKNKSEGPPHEVTITRAFYIGKYEVTRAQWKAIMGSKSDGGEGDNLPVNQLTWGKAVEFCQKLSEKTGDIYRLPTEAEWLYACQAGATTIFYWGDGEDEAPEYAWFGDTWGEVKPVGQKLPNAWGLFDMCGNVSEWCSDFHANFPVGSAEDPQGPTSGHFRLVRGGNYSEFVRGLKSSYRYKSLPEDSSVGIGFRVVMEVK